MHEIITSEQAAGMLQFSTAYVRTLAANGEIPAIKYGDDWRFVRSQLIDHLTECAKLQQDRRKREKEREVIEGVMSQVKPEDMVRRRGRPRRLDIANIGKNA